MAASDSQEDIGCARGVASPLLPILEGPHGHAEHFGELGLRKSGPHACLRDTGERDFAHGAFIARFHLTNGGQQLRANVSRP